MLIHGIEGKILGQNPIFQDNIQTIQGKIPGLAGRV